VSFLSLESRVAHSAHCFFAQCNIRLHLSSYIFSVYPVAFCFLTLHTSIRNSSKVKSNLFSPGQSRHIKSLGKSKQPELEISVEVENHFPQHDRDCATLVDLQQLPFCHRPRAQYRIQHNCVRILTCSLSRSAPVQPHRLRSRQLPAASACPSQDFIHMNIVI
jgi:hypothetical protein